MNLFKSLLRLLTVLELRQRDYNAHFAATLTIFLTSYQATPQKQKPKPVCQRYINQAEAYKHSTYLSCGRRPLFPLKEE